MTSKKTVLQKHKHEKSPVALINYDKLYNSYGMSNTSHTKHANSYAWSVIDKRQYYADKEGAMKETTPDEIKKLIALFLYHGLIKASTYERYWSTASLYHGLWARKFMARDKFKALTGVLHIVDSATENGKHKSRKLTPFVNSFKTKC